MTAERKMSKTSLTLDADKMKLFAIECIRRGVTQSARMIEAIDMWMRPAPLAPVFGDEFTRSVMLMLNDPRNESELLLRNLLKSAVNIRSIGDDELNRRSVEDDRLGRGKHKR